MEILISVFQKMQMKTVESVVSELEKSGENITVFVHNQTIQLKRIRAKGQQIYRFYGGKEAEEDRIEHNFWVDVLIKLTEKRPTLIKIYGVPNKI
jgi:Mrp family chromosome partitioning ATPase